MDEHTGPDVGRNDDRTAPRKVIVPPPIDMDHLSRQTLGDGGIAREVLGLFLIEIGTAREVIRAETESERRELAHRLKGAARAIGAFSLAETAGHIEDTPGDDRLVADFLQRVLELEDFIASFKG
jgi:HPt (histidine-containing phosphotransfer) domain-containing protein